MADNQLATTNDYDKWATENFNQFGFCCFDYPCACMGPRNGEPVCPCKMIRDAEERVFARANIAQQLRGILVIKEATE